MTWQTTETHRFFECNDQAFGRVISCLPTQIVQRAQADQDEERQSGTDLKVRQKFLLMRTDHQFQLK